MPDIECGENRADSAAIKLHDARDMRRGIDGYPGTIFRLAGHDALRKGCPHGGRYTPDGSHHGDQGCEVIRANVEHGPGAGLIEEMRIGMPVFHTVVQLESSCRYRRPDHTIVDQFDAGLKATAEKCIGGIANA